jgi:hypothetical protein
VIFIKKNRFYATETLLGLLIRNVRLKKMRWMDTSFAEVHEFLTG